MSLGLSEILIILVVALLVVGPERLPKLARTLGSAMRQLRATMREVTDSLETDVPSPKMTASTDPPLAAQPANRIAGTPSDPTLPPEVIADSPPPDQEGKTA